MNTMMYGEVETGTAVALRPDAPSPYAMLLEKAATSGNLAVFEKGMELEERWHATQARRAFAQAMAKAKGEMPIIIKNRVVDFTSSKGRTYYQYEDLAEVVRTVAPILSKHGLSHRWRGSNTRDSVTVTCVIEHEMGHFEENTEIGPWDPSGNKNAQQALRSAKTYYERSTLKSSLGLAADSEEDDDARSAGKPVRRPPSASVRTDEVVVEDVQEQEQPQAQGPREITTGAGAKDWVAKYIAGIKTAKDGKELAQWATVNTLHLATLTTKYPDLRAQVDEVFNKLLTGEKPKGGTVFMSGGKETGRTPPSAQASTDQTDSAQWRKDMEGALSGCTTEDDIKKYRGEIDNAPDGVLKSDIDLVEAAMKQAVDRVILGK